MCDRSFVTFVDWGLLREVHELLDFEVNERDDPIPWPANKRAAGDGAIPVGEE